MSNIDRLKHNFLSIKEQIEKAAVQSGRPADGIEIVIASKYCDDIGDLMILKELGASAFGENRLQSLEEKFRNCSESGLQLNWHFIGHIQSNKAKKIVTLVSLIQSVDSVRIAQIINEHAKALGKKQKILLQLKVSDESAKTGFALDDIDAACGEIAGLSNISVDGLMVIPPIVPERELVSLFKLASNTLSRLQSIYNIGDTLSMGMSGDFELAIREGANMVRIGSAIWR